jgi:type IV secretory pathway TraG/TraD family ATPase VirD4
LGREKTVLFLNQSDTDHTFSRIVNLFITQTFRLLCNEADNEPDSRLQVPVRIILDDFATGAVIPDFDKLISVIRSRDIYVSIILQSISQLDSVYGSSHAGNAVTKTIVNNCDTILFLGGQDEETEHFVAKKCLKTEDTIHTKPREKAYLMVAGKIGRLTDKIVPYSTLEVKDGSDEYI